MADILHMVPVEAWSHARGAPSYSPDSLPAEGFIHCTVGERNLIEVATRYYGHVQGEWLVLVINPARVEAEIRWVVQPDGLAYPHIHGPLNRDAVIEVCRFPRDAGGGFGAFRSLPWPGAPGTAK